MRDLIGEEAQRFTDIISKAKSIVVSGPLGVYENSEFCYGTKTVLQAIADSDAFSLAGGGNTIAAIDEYGLTEKISYISTAGGALIEFLMGKKLPGVVALENAAKTKKVYAVPAF
jgi:phosphoglycerate kinase